jgi:hypothetical protein
MFPQQPIPTAADPDTQFLHSNSTITASGSQVFSGFGTKEISIVVNVTASPTGTSPTLTFTLQEVDPGDLTTVFGTVASTGTINAIGIYTASLVATTGGSVLLSWTIGGTSGPTFTGVYSTVTAKLGINSTVTGSASVTAAQGTAAALSGGWPVKVTDGTNTLPTGDAAARAIFEKITDGTNTAAVTASSALKVDGSAVTQPVSAASLPLPTGAATSANQTTLGSQTTKINDGTNTATVKPASTAAVATDTAIVVAISPNNSITASNPSVGSNNAALPSSSTEIGGSDGTNLQAVRVFDADTGGGTQYVLGAVLRKSASGGSVEAGTSSDPLRVDPTGTTAQPVTDNAGSLTVDSPQLPAALVGGRLDENVGAWLGSTAPTVGSKTSANSVPVVVASDQGAIPITDNAGSLTVDGTVTSNQGTAAALSGGWPVKVTDGTNTMPTGDVAARAIFEKITDGTNTASVTASSALKVDGSAVTQPISAASLPLPTGASTSANQTTLGSQTTKVNDGTNTAAVKAASTAAAAADPALVVAVSPNNTVLVADPNQAIGKGLATGSTSWQGGYLATSSTSILAIRASTYLPQSANFTATLVSSSANDTSAGTAARTILVTYFDQAMAGPFTETITMNGTSNVTASNSNYCYIESIVVVTAGSYGANQGNISLKNGGTTVATVLADEVKTNLAHHYVASGKTCFIRNISLSSTVVNGSCIVKVQNPVTANSIPQQLGNFIRTISVQPQYSYPMGDLPVVGPAFIALYFRSDTATANVIYGGFTSYDA